MKWTSAKDLGVGFERRRFLAYFSGLGLAGTLLPGTLWAQVSAGRASKVTVEMVEAAARIAGLEFDEEERQALLTWSRGAWYPDPVGAAGQDRLDGSARASE